MKKTMILILIFLFLPAIGMRTNDSIEKLDAELMNRRSRELREIDEIIKLQNQIRYRSRSRSRSPRPPVNRCITTRQITTIAIGVIGLATGILTVVQLIFQR